MSEHSGKSPRAEFDGQAPALVDRVVNLMDASGDLILNMTHDQACRAVRGGNAEAVRRIRGQFAICQQQGKTIRMARSIGRPMRYFLAKRAEGPALIIAERMSQIIDQLRKEGLADQFHPSYTRMVPAHYLLELQLVGCPDPNPQLTRYFAPERNRLPADIDAIGATYVGRLAEVIDQYLATIPEDHPIGVMFSGGIDSGSILVLVDHLLRRRGQSPSRIKAFTLAVEGKAGDLEQARQFLKAVNLEMLLESIEVPAADVRWQDAIKSIEDYKPLDVQSATMGYALLREIRKRYPDWKYLIDGDGGDENLKDYPIEENSELTIRSVLGNRMLYQEGWGVDAVKHSLVYSGGQSRGHSRTSAPAAEFGFTGLSPYAIPDVIEIAEAVPFVALTDWDHKKLYSLKGEIVASGIRQLTGTEMPVFEKRRFQHGAADKPTFERMFPTDDQDYRDEFSRMIEAKMPG
jgi:asparagine synthase (glutamine-hydrolysing)